MLDSGFSKLLVALRDPYGAYLFVAILSGSFRKLVGHEFPAIQTCCLEFDEGIIRSTRDLNISGRRNKDFFA